DLTGRLALPPLTLEILSRPMPVSPGAQWPATRGTP
ncbi:SecB chaperone, partial [Mycobacterium tuberculosis]